MKDNLKERKELKEQSKRILLRPEHRQPKNGRKEAPTDTVPWE